MKRTYGVMIDVFHHLIIYYFFTLMSWEILEMWKVSTETTTPSWSRKPATTRGTPGRNDWAHHFSSLNLRSTKIKALASSQRHDMKMAFFTLSSTCGSCCAVWACRSLRRSSAPRNRQEELELWDLCPDSPPRQRTAVCDPRAGFAPQCRRPRWC